MNEQKHNSGVAFSVRGPDAFLHRGVAGARAAAGCQCGEWRRDRASGEPQTTTDSATRSGLSWSPEQASVRAAGCLMTVRMAAFCSETGSLTLAAGRQHLQQITTPADFSRHKLIRVISNKWRLLGPTAK